MSSMASYDELKQRANPGFYFLFYRMTFAQEVNGALTIPAYWQSAWSASYNAMTLAGSLVAGQVQDWFGRRICFLVAVISSAAGVAVIYTAQDSAHFLGGKILTGFALGLALTAGQTYVSEIAPMPMRSIALSVNTIMMVRANHPALHRRIRMA